MGRSPTPSRYLHPYIATVCVGAALLFAQAAHRGDILPAGYWSAFGALVGLGVLAELFFLRLRVGTTTTAVSFVPYLAAILLGGPGFAMLVAGTTDLVAETLIRRKPLIKVLHNTAKEVLAVGLAGHLYVSLGGEPSAAEFAIAVTPFLLSSVVYFTVNNGSVATVLSLSSGSDLREEWRAIVGRDLVHNVVSSFLAGLLVFLYIELQVLGLALVLIPLFFLRHAHHANLQLEEANRDLLELMVKSIEARDPYTSGHSVRVAAYAKALAREVGLPAREIRQVETAALLHDVGKIYEDYAPLLRKEGKLSADERLLMQSHPVRSAELVGTISSLRGYVEQCVRHHHEHFDGSGYPDALMGPEIPIGARIIMIADTADAMTTDRPYRVALTYHRLIAELERYSGSQFDPLVVDAFKRSRQIATLIEERQDVTAEPAPIPNAAIRPVWRSPRTREGVA